MHLTLLVVIWCSYMLVGTFCFLHWVLRNIMTVWLQLYAVKHKYRLPDQYYLFFLSFFLSILHHICYSIFLNGDFSVGEICYFFFQSSNKSLILYYIPLFYFWSIWCRFYLTQPSLLLPIVKIPCYSNFYGYVGEPSLSSVNFSYYSWCDKKNNTIC